MRIITKSRIMGAINSLVGFAYFSVPQLRGFRRLMGVLSLCAVLKKVFKKKCLIRIVLPLMMLGMFANSYAIFGYEGVLNDYLQTPANRALYQANIVKTFVTTAVAALMSFTLESSMASYAGSMTHLKIFRPGSPTYNYFTMVPGWWPGASKIIAGVSMAPLAMTLGPVAAPVVGVSGLALVGIGSTQLWLNNAMRKSIEMQLAFEEKFDRLFDQAMSNRMLSFHDAESKPTQWIVDRLNEFYHPNNQSMLVNQQEAILNHNLLYTRLEMGASGVSVVGNAAAFGTVAGYRSAFITGELYSVGSMLSNAALLHHQNQFLPSLENRVGLDRFNPEHVGLVPFWRWANEAALLGGIGPMTVQGGVAATVLMETISCGGDEEDSVFDSIGSAIKTLGSYVVSQLPEDPNQEAAAPMQGYGAA